MLLILVSPGSKGHFLQAGIPKGSLLFICVLSIQTDTVCCSFIFKLYEIRISGYPYAETLTIVDSVFSDPSE